jgi:hypothetical protein
MPAVCTLFGFQEVPISIMPVPSGCQNPVCSVSNAVGTTVPLHVQEFDEAVACDDGRTLTGHVSGIQYLFSGDIWTYTFDVQMAGTAYAGWAVFNYLDAINYVGVTQAWGVVNQTQCIWKSDPSTAVRVRSVCL